MSSSAALDQLDTLDDRLDALLPFLTPLLARNITDTATSLPVADKARLYVLVTYVLESLLFSYAKLNSLPTTHVMTELSRVRQYVAKVKAAAAATTGPPTQQLDTQAAGRFIKAALAGNEEYDREKREREEREKAKAAEKLAAIEAGMKEEGEVEGKDTGGKKKLKGKRKDREEGGVGEEKETKKKVGRSKEEKEARRKKRKEKRKETRAKSKSS